MSQTMPSVRNKSKERSKEGRSLSRDRGSRREGSLRRGREGEDKERGRDVGSRSGLDRSMSGTRNNSTRTGRDGTSRTEKERPSTSSDEVAKAASETQKRRAELEARKKELEERAAKREAEAEALAELERKKREELRVQLEKEKNMIDREEKRMNLVEEERSRRQAEEAEALARIEKERRDKDAEKLRREEQQEDQESTKIMDAILHTIEPNDRMEDIQEKYDKMQEQLDEEKAREKRRADEEERSRLEVERARMERERAERQKREQERQEERNKTIQLPESHAKWRQITTRNDTDVSDDNPSASTDVERESSQRSKRSRSRSPILNPNVITMLDDLKIADKEALEYDDEEVDRQVRPMDETPTMLEMMIPHLPKEVTGTVDKVARTVTGTRAAVAAFKGAFNREDNILIEENSEEGSEKSMQIQSQEQTMYTYPPDGEAQATELNVPLSLENMVEMSKETSSWTANLVEEVKDLTAKLRASEAANFQMNQCFERKMSDKTSEFQKQVLERDTEIDRLEIKASSQSKDIENARATLRLLEQKITDCRDKENANDKLREEVESVVAQIDRERYLRQEAEEACRRRDAALAEKDGEIERLRKIATEATRFVMDQKKSLQHFESYRRSTSTMSLAPSSGAEGGSIMMLEPDELRIINENLRHLNVGDGQGQGAASGGLTGGRASRQREDNGPREANRNRQRGSRPQEEDDAANMQRARERRERQQEENDARRARDRRDELPGRGRRNDGRDSQATRRRDNTEDDTDGSVYRELPHNIHDAAAPPRGMSRTLEAKEAVKRLQNYCWPVYEHFSTAVGFRRTFELQIEKAKSEGIPQELIANAISSHFIKDSRMAQKFGNLAKTYETRTLDGISQVIAHLNPSEDSLGAEEKFRMLQMHKNENGLDYVQRLAASHDDLFPNGQGRNFRIKNQFLDNFKHGDYNLTASEKLTIGAYDILEMATVSKKVLEQKMAAKKDKTNLDINALDQPKEVQKLPVQQPQQAMPQMVQQPMQYQQMAPQQMQMPQMVQQAPQLVQQGAQMMQQVPQMARQQQQQQPRRQNGVRRPLRVPFSDRVPAADGIQRITMEEYFAGKTEDGTTFCFNCYVRGHVATDCGTMSYCHYCNKETNHTTRVHRGQQQSGPRQDVDKREAMVSL